MFNIVLAQSLTLTLYLQCHCTIQMSTVQSNKYYGRVEERLYIVVVPVTVFPEIFC